MINIKNGCPGLRTCISDGSGKATTKRPMLRKVPGLLLCPGLAITNLQLRPDTLSKSKVTGINQVDQLQDDVHNLVGNQLGERGLLAPVGNAVSKQGINRAERGGKDEDGSYGGPAAPITDRGVDAAKSMGCSVAAGAKSIGGAFTR